MKYLVEALAGMGFGILWGIGTSYGKWLYWEWTAIRDAKRWGGERMGIGNRFRWLP